jgi:hypothetical protein
MPGDAGRPAPQGPRVGRIVGVVGVVGEQLTPLRHSPGGLTLNHGSQIEIIVIRLATPAIWSVRVSRFRSNWNGGIQDRNWRRLANGFG